MGQRQHLDGFGWRRPASHRRYATRYLTAGGREIPISDQTPERARRSGTAEPAAVVGLLLNDELRWVMLPPFPWRVGMMAAV